MTEISFKVKDDPMNFMQRFPSLKYQDRRDRKICIQKRGSYYEILPQNDMNTAQKTVPGWSKRSKGKKLKDGADQVIFFFLSFVCRFCWQNRIRTTQHKQSINQGSNKVKHKNTINSKRCDRKYTNKCTNKNKD